MTGVVDEDGAQTTLLSVAAQQSVQKHSSSQKPAKGTTLRAVTGDAARSSSVAVLTGSGGAFGVVVEERIQLERDKNVWTL